MIVTRNGIEVERRMVRLDGRTFVIRINLDGTARSILERKQRSDGVIRDETYWHFTHGVPVDGRGAFFGGKSLVRRVLEAVGATYDHLPNTADQADERLAA